MPERTWIIPIAAHEYTLRLNHGTLSGRRQVWVDGTLVLDERKLVDAGSWHAIRIGETEIDLLIVTNGWNFRYYLFQGERPLLSDDDLRRGRTVDQTLKDHRLGLLLFWRQLGHVLGLSFLPQRQHGLNLGQRLIGLLGGHLVVIQAGMLAGTTRPGYSVYARHAPPLFQENTTQARADPRLVQLLGNLHKSRDVFSSSASGSVIFLPLVNNEGPIELAARVRTFLQVIATYFNPPPLDRCEGEACSQQFASQRRLVLVNGNLLSLCPDCLAKIPGWGEKNHQHYRQAPGNLLPGILVGVGVALVGAVLWAAVAFLLDALAAFVSMLILVWIVKAMDKVETKHTATSLALAALLTLLSVTVGNSFSIFLFEIRHGFPINLRTLLQAWAALWAEPRLLWLSYFFTLLGAGSFLWSIWSRRQNYLNRAFKPEVEVLPV
jgi:hypothetical protein